MSLSPQHEPRRPRSSGGLGWLIPLLLIAPPIIREVQRRTAGVLTNEQLLMIVAGVGALIVLGVVARRTWTSTTSQPSTYDVTKRPSYTPQPPKFEPIVTGKLMLAGLGLGVLFALGVVVMLTML